MHAINIHRGRRLAKLKPELGAQTVFMLLYPGFFFYQTVLGLGLIGAFLGGYFTLVAFLLTPALVLFKRMAGKRDGHERSAFDLYCAVCAAYYLLTLAINVGAGATPMIAERYVQSLIFCIDTYVMFRLVDLEDKKFITLAAISLLIMSGITIRFSIDGFFYLQALGQAKDPDSLATYQGFARSYIYTYLIVVSVARSIGVRFFLYGIAAASLFLNGARSEFSAALFSIPVIELYHTRHKVLSVVPILFLLVLFLLNSDAIVGMLPDNRTLQLLDLSHSTSAQARQHLSSDAWRTITEHPILGDFASYPDGHYAHNMLAGWVDFGLVGFLLFAGLLVVPLFRLVVDGFFLKPKTPEFVLAFSLISIATLWALSAKNIPDMSVGAALGAFAKYRYGRKLE